MYCYISKEMLYFGLDIFCYFEAKVPEFAAVCSVQCTLYIPQLLGGRLCVTNSWTPASYRQNTASPKYNEDISLLISQYFLSGCWCATNFPTHPAQAYFHFSTKNYFFLERLSVDNLISGDVSRMFINTISKQKSRINP